MRNLVHLDESRAADSTHSDKKRAGTDRSTNSVLRHLGRIIIGWLAIIIVVQLAVKYFGWS